MLNDPNEVIIRILKEAKIADMSAIDAVPSKTY
jgi:hypothetical protein